MRSRTPHGGPTLEERSADRATDTARSSREGSIGMSPGRAPDAARRAAPRTRGVLVQPDLDRRVRTQARRERRTRRHVAPDVPDLPPLRRRQLQHRAPRARRARQVASRGLMFERARQSTSDRGINRQGTIPLGAPALIPNPNPSPGTRVRIPIGRSALPHGVDDRCQLTDGHPPYTEHTKEGGHHAG